MLCSVGKLCLVINMSVSSRIVCFGMGFNVGCVVGCLVCCVVGCVMFCVYVSYYTPEIKIIIEIFMDTK